MIGGGGADTLEGGSGADRFVFGVGDSTSGTPDIIWGFKHGNDADKIDPSALSLTGSTFTRITTAGGLQINILDYYKSSTDLTAADFVF